MGSTARLADTVMDAVAVATDGLDLDQLARELDLSGDHAPLERTRVVSVLQDLESDYYLSADGPGIASRRACSAAPGAIAGSVSGSTLASGRGPAEVPKSQRRRLCGGSDMRPDSRRRADPIQRRIETRAPAGYSAARP